MTTTTTTISTTSGTTSGTAPALLGDPYARSAELDETTATALARRFDVRAADPRQHQLWDQFLSRAPRIDHARVLEVGCGTGIITLKIADLPGVDEAVGIDPSTHFIAAARHRAPHLHFETADGRALPFADQSFDGVILATTLCHIPQPETALTEVHRVLRPGGYLLIYDGDYATTTVALHDHDPLQTCVHAAITKLVHDPWLIRRLPALVTAAGLRPGQMHGHSYLELDNPTYIPTLVEVGADHLTATGAITAITATALKNEANDRATNNRFFGHIAYASMLAIRPRP